MKRVMLILVVCMLGALSSAEAKNDLLKYVNTLQGSNNTFEFSHGRCNPIVATPHGVNIWIPKQGRFVSGNISIGPHENASGDEKTEHLVAKPNHHSLGFPNGVIAEVAATERCGAFAFTYPRGLVPSVVVDYAKGEVAYLEGAKRVFISGATNVVLAFDKPFVEMSKVGENRMVFTFDKKTQRVEAKISISKIDLEQAQVTFAREIASKDFAAVKEESGEIWNDLLNQIYVEGGTEEETSTFYSCLYRANLRPHKTYEVDANGNPRFFFEEEVHEGEYYQNPILWDAFRTLLPLQNIIDTQNQHAYVQSLMRTKELTHWWPSGSVMIGNHAISVLADAWVKGIRSFDPQKALQYYYHEITRSKLDSIENRDYNIEHVRGYGRMGYEDYFAKGYIPYPQNTNRVMETTAKTLEYNYDDFCAYRLAQMTGNKFYETLFEKHIYNYRNVFDPRDHFMKGRDADGVFDLDFNPYEWGNAFVEGDGWQWKWYVPQDPQGLIDLIGGDKQFIKELDELFSVPADSVLCGGYGFMIHEINEAVASGMGQYAPGNEPCFHIIYLYDYAGAPWKCQEKIRETFRLFDSTPNGFPGDDDGGVMSAWYVFSTMGFYPVTPGTDQYALGSPLFKRITLTLEDGKQFIINAEANAPGNVYISEAKLNGMSISRSYLTHKELMEGGELQLDMSDKPNYQRGTADVDRPISLSAR